MFIKVIEKCRASANPIQRSVSRKSNKEIQLNEKVGGVKIRSTKVRVSRILYEYFRGMKAVVEGEFELL